MSRLCCAVLSSFALLASPLLAFADEYPSKPIRLVVPYAAGGGVDTVSRSIAKELGASLRVPLIVDDRPGGNSVIGSAMVARSTPDGYTLLATLGSHYAMPFLAKNVPYNPVKDFAPVTVVGRAPQALVVNSSFPVRTVQELIDYARKNPGKVTFATSGTGTSQHLAGELLNATAQIRMIHVPYKGGGPALNDLLGGHVPVAILILSNVLPHVKAGKLRILGIVESRRAKATPEVPTVAEAGVPGFAVPDTWIGIMGPAGLPAPVVTRLNNELAKVVDRPEVRLRLDTAGFEVNVVPSSEFERIGPRTTEIYRRLTSEAKIEPE